MNRILVFLWLWLGPAPSTWTDEPAELWREAGYAWTSSLGEWVPFAGLSLWMGAIAREQPAGTL